MCHTDIGGNAKKRSIVKSVTMQTSPPEPTLQSCGFISSSLTSTGIVKESSESFAVHPDEPNLYQIPTDLKPIYQPLPIIWKACIWCGAAFAAAAWAHHGTEWNWMSGLVAEDIHHLLGFLVVIIFITVTGQLILEELFLPPTRITTSTLIRDYVLPTKLSKYETVKLELPTREEDRNMTTTLEMGIHYLEYKQKEQQKSPQFQAFYGCHGYGASSLTPMPVIPGLVDRLRAQTGRAHDAAGFGFTDRPDNLAAYTHEGTAAVGMSLLEPMLSTGNTDDKPVMLMGHSMGSLATLQMAIELPKDTKKWVLLVAPALGFRPNVTGLEWYSLLIHCLLSNTSAIMCYCLKRLVGAKNFWRKALEMVVFADPNKLTDGTVMRFQWPAISLGWEEGLVKHARALISEPTTFTDKELVEQVVADPNAVITVIVASKDLVVTPQYIQTFLKPYSDQIKLVEMEGLGHDPFEENVDGFLDLVEDLWEDEQDRLNLGRLPA